MIGKTLGHYAITSQLGKGGMGEVYEADDLNLGRKVALKFLPEGFAGDPERMARFEREAKLLASLNHPNIASIYGLEQAEGKRFLVMELVEGETLAQRVKKGALTVEEALAICRQIADGLEAAHDKGVIHRDLKPANVMVTEGDKVKILDFGLAKALSQEAQSIDSSQSPTLTEAMTRPGMILGTAAYMSPEQAKGKAVDKRADIWAFGCILYECLTVKKAFEGETVSETLAAILKSEPDWQALPATTPPNIRFVLRRCLEKNVNNRFRDAADVRIEIEEARDIGEAVSPVKRPWLAWSTAALFFFIAAALSFVHLREQPPLAEMACFQIPFPDKVSFGSGGDLVISPDGRLLAFSAIGSDGNSRLWLRALNSFEVRSLSGTEGFGGRIIWSPDSRFIAFSTGGKLKKIDVSGGPPLPICDLSAGTAAGSWNRDGVILLGSPNGLMRVPSVGGTEMPVTKVNPALKESGHSSPVFLTDGRHFLYVRRSSSLESTGIYIGSLDLKPEEQTSKPLVAGLDAFFVYAPSQNSGSGHLLCVRDQTLMVQPFDEKSLELAGEPIAIAAQVGSNSYYPLVSVSATGVLVYTSSVNSRIAWVDRNGRELGRIGEPGVYPTFALSRDASRLVVSRDQGIFQRNLWILDLVRGPMARLTLEEDTRHSDPRWSADDREILFTSTRGFGKTIFRLSLTSSNPVKILELSNFSAGLDDWSSDGRYILYHDTPRADLWAMPLSGDQKPVLAAHSLSGQADQAQFSPDGRWIAYNTNESGRFEVKVIPFPPTGDKWTVSTEGGFQPTWRGDDGRELYFLKPDGTLMAVDVRAGKVFEWGEIHPLFQTHLNVLSNTEQYAPAPDGKKFIVVAPDSEVATASINVVLNWASMLKK
ncbi:MAG: serine/threonine-protein kinase [Acidobacteria bacterium]|nr:serine/threonine-protein kinase [Acidobacteriota bacterium]